MYGVYRGREGNQVYKTWTQTQANTQFMRGARFKKFTCYEDARYFSRTARIPPPFTTYTPHDGIHIHVWSSAAVHTTHSRAGVGVVFGKSGHVHNFKGPLHIAPFTQQRADLYAIISALNQTLLNYDLKEFDGLIVHTDSQYAINCITKWITKWLKNNWNDNSIKNRDLIEPLYTACTKYPVTIYLVNSEKDPVDNNNNDNPLRGLARELAADVCCDFQ